MILGGAQAVADSGTENEVDEQIHELREELNWFYHRVEREQLSQEGSSPEQLRALQKEAAIREHRLLRLIREAPDSAAVGVALRQSSTATLADIREALGPEAALIEYFAIDNRIHAAVVTPDSVRFIPLASFEAITPHLRMLAFQFSKFKLGREYVSSFAESLLRTTQTHLLLLTSFCFYRWSTCCRSGNWSSFPMARCTPCRFTRSLTGTAIWPMISRCATRPAPVFLRSSPQATNIRWPIIASWR